MEKLITFTIESLLLPPGGVFLLLTIGLVLLKHRARAGKILLVAGTVALYLFASPWFSAALMGTLERDPALPTQGELPRDDRSAMVILGGGRYLGAPEYGGDTVAVITLERLRYGARLARRAGLPVLVTGGSVWDEHRAEAELMREALQTDFGLETRWTETQSRTTWENALYSAPILKQAGIERIYLVTHAWHMRRAVLAFEHTGLTVFPAPTSFTHFSDVDAGAFAWWPDARSLRRSYFATHEMLGYVWYRIKVALAD